MCFFFGTINDPSISSVNLSTGAHTLVPATTAPALTVNASGGGGTLQLTNSSGNAFFADANGNVGIGTGVPLSKLHINGNLLGNHIYAQLIRYTASTFNAAGGFTPIYWETGQHYYSNGITHQYQTQDGIQFQYPGTYLINIGWRAGAGDDVWTFVSLRDSALNLYGNSHGIGNFAPTDPGSAQWSFMARITNTSLKYGLYVWRGGGALTVVASSISQLPVIMATLLRIGD